MAGLGEARGCSRGETMPEDEEEEELLPSQGHEADGVEGQCWHEVWVPLGWLLARVHHEVPVHMRTLSCSLALCPSPLCCTHAGLTPASIQLWPCAQVGWAFPLWLSAV